MTMLMQPLRIDPYRAYEGARVIGQPFRQAMRSALPFMRLFPQLGVLTALYNTVAHARLTHDRPNYDISETTIDGETVEVVQETVVKKHFCNLIRFNKVGVTDLGPPVLIVAPLSGHWATLVRSTIEGMLPKHAVFVTDWKSARDVPLSLGRFGVDDYIDYVMEFARHIYEVTGMRVNVMAVCQAAPLVLAASSIMSEDNEDARPATMIPMAGPIDPRVEPTEVNCLAFKHTIEEFRDNVIDTVPWPLRGEGRRVYAGFRQFGGFLSMNLVKHARSHYKEFLAHVMGDGDSDSQHRMFYEEFCAMLDLTAEFFLETVERVFQKSLLPKGKFYHRGRLVNPSKITDTATLVIEGENDDITGRGQTEAVFKLLTGLSQDKMRYHLAKKVGHYGVFSGTMWRKVTQPIVAEFIRAHNN